MRAMGPHGDDVDARIRALLGEGNAKAAATEAIRVHGPGLLRYLRALLGHEEEAKEAFAGACERLWRSLASFRGEASVRTWFFRLGWSAAADLRKEAWRSKARRLETDEAAELAADGETRSWLRKERLRLGLAELRRALTLEEQSLLQLRIDQRLSWAECAEVLAGEGEALSVDALMKRFERLKARLAALAREKAG